MKLSRHSSPHNTDSAHIIVDRPRTFDQFICPDVITVNIGARTPACVFVIMISEGSMPVAVFITAITVSYYRVSRVTQ